MREWGPLLLLRALPMPCIVSAVSTCLNRHAGGVAGCSRAMAKGASRVDDQRFDALSRTLANATSRRQAARQFGVAGAIAALSAIFGRQQIASAYRCNYEGCGCATGTSHACGSGLVCCASSPGTPGGAGVCTPRGQCDGSCIERGNSCPGYCNWNDGCSGCCSGYCGPRGSCDQPPNLSQSCAGYCQYGLICCPHVPGLTGGAGVCQYRC
jgi:hypothetical protein